MLLTAPKTPSTYAADTWSGEVGKNRLPQCDIGCDAMLQHKQVMLKQVWKLEKVPECEIHIHKIHRRCQDPINAVGTTLAS